MVSSGPFVCRRSAEISRTVSLVAADTPVAARNAARPSARAAAVRFRSVVRVIKSLRFAGSFFG